MHDRECNGHDDIGRCQADIFAEVCPKWAGLVTGPVGLLDSQPEPASEKPLLKQWANQHSNQEKLKVAYCPSQIE